MSLDLRDSHAASIVLSQGKAKMLCKIHAVKATPIAREMDHMTVQRLWIM